MSKCMVNLQHFQEPIYSVILFCFPQHCSVFSGERDPNVSDCPIRCCGLRSHEPSLLYKTALCSQTRITHTCVEWNKTCFRFILHQTFQSSILICKNMASLQMFLMLFQASPHYCLKQKNVWSLNKVKKSLSTDTVCYFCNCIVFNYGNAH